MTQFSLEIYEQKFKMLNFSELSILILCRIINSALQSKRQLLVLLLKKFHIRSGRRPICDLNLGELNLLAPNLSVL
jgi:hypothetical protein